MNKFIYFFSTAIFLSLTIISCGKNDPDSPNGGWYLISENNEIIGDMIFSKNDVEEIWVDSSLIDGRNIHKVTGGFTPNATARLAVFTEQNIGKRFGFALDREVITSDIISQKDDEGRFSILFNKKSKAQRAYESLLIDVLNTKQ